MPYYPASLAEDLANESARAGQQGDQRRTNVVGAILAEQHDERQASDRRHLAMSSTVTLNLEQTITLGLEAIKPECHRLGFNPHLPLNERLPRSAGSATRRAT
jgi:hypothetical protein